MNKIEIFGDSLTAGNCGESWIRLVNEPFALKAFGLDGDTLSGIAARCLRHLKRETPEFLVLEAGANDILQPFMKTKGAEWFKFVEEMNKRGAVAAFDAEIFISNYEDFLKEIQTLFKGPILIMSLPLLSEDPDHILNKTAEQYNRLLEIFCRENNIVYADIYTPLKTCLTDHKSGQEYFHYYNEDPGLFVRDIKAVRSGISWDDITRKRGLKVTVDGSHLNKKGAQIVAETFRESIKKHKEVLN